VAPKKTPSKSSSKNQNPYTSIDFQELKSVLELMDQHGLAEFEWEQGGTRLSLKNRHAFPAQVLAAGAASPSANGMSAGHGGSGASASPVAKLAPATNQKQVMSPFVGTFYRSAAPGKDPYVKEGQVIKPGDVLCIVEAMKLMNEIEAEFGGKILTILVDNGQPVEFGEPLFVLET